MYKVVAYELMMWWLKLYYLLHHLNNNQFYYHFYVDTEFRTPYTLTSSTHFLASILSSSSYSIATTTPILTGGKGAL